MRERDMRELVHKVLHKVVYPGALGVGLALAAGCGGDGGEKYAAPLYAAPSTDQSVLMDQGVKSDQGLSSDGSAALYAAPMPDQGLASDAIPMKYMAPLDGDAGSDGQ